MMPQARNEESHSVRLPAGVRDQLVAATGMSFSTLMRDMALQLLAIKKAEMSQKEQTNGQ